MLTLWNRRMNARRCISHLIYDVPDWVTPRCHETGPSARREHIYLDKRATASRISAHDLDLVALSARWSITSFGTMRPKLIARMMDIAVMPSAIVALISSTVVCVPSASCRRPLAMRNRKMPGSIEPFTNILASDRWSLPVHELEIVLLIPFAFTSVMGWQTGGKSR